MPRLRLCPHPQRSPPLTDPQASTKGPSVPAGTQRGLGSGTLSWPEKRCLPVGQPAGGPGDRHGQQPPRGGSLKVTGPSPNLGAQPREKETPGPWVMDSSDCAGSGGPGTRAEPGVRAQGRWAGLSVRASLCDKPSGPGSGPVAGGGAVRSAVWKRRPQSSLGLGVLGRPRVPWEGPSMPRP